MEWLPSYLLGVLCTCVVVVTFMVCLNRRKP